MATIAECGVHATQAERSVVRSVEIDDEFAPVSPRAYARWLEVFERDAAAGVFADPDLVLAEASDAFDRYKRRALLFECLQCGEPRAAAALLPKEIRTASVGTIGFSAVLRGYVAAGKRCLVAAPGIDCEDDATGSERVLGDLLRAVAEFLRESRSDFLLFEDLEPTGPLWDALQTLDGRRYRVLAPQDFQSRLRIRFSGSAHEYWSQFSSTTRGKLRRKLKKMGPVAVERITSAEQAPGFLRAAHEISRRTWQSERLGLRVHNDEAERRLFGMLAEKGALRSYLLRKDEQPIAFLIGNQFHGYFNHEEIGFDRDFAQQSPGQVLLIKALDDLLEHDRPEWLDFGGGDAEYKRQFANQRSSSGNVWVVPKTLRLELILGYMGVCRGVNRAARRILANTGLLTRVRQIVRRGREGSAAECGMRRAE